VRLAPRFVEARLTLGVALGSRGRLQEAITQFERALGIDPGSAAAHYYLGSALARANRLEEAEGHLEAALRAEPDHRDAASGLEAVQAQRAAKARPSLGRALLR
jgi:tetratricopeptide (TPR) repeat protein